MSVALTAYVSMQRIESFLAEEEVPDWASSLKAIEAQYASPGCDQGPIGFDRATFEWHGRSETSDGSGTITPGVFRLSELDISFPVGKLTLIAGRTGSGKSALLNALLGGGANGCFLWRCNI